MYLCTWFYLRSGVGDSYTCMFPSKSHGANSSVQSDILKGTGELIKSKMIKKLIV